MANVERCDPAVYRQQWEYYYSDYILLFYLNFYYKRYVYVRPCTKYPIHGIKACVAKQGDTYLNGGYAVKEKIIRVKFLLGQDADFVFS
ncbi:hypothetical protein BpHYR1_035326 [Brachionus plicatilis]|uniref:Uncharacterized protein n=1 Tax=Brachionus plicatilis TaxID=10195 RepID=A0A3M7PMA7_BRAPC|nr:hypothetical protein BpHYR1_035326 [Brachionus plicatilis]